MKLHAASALLPGGWADDVLIEIDAGGTIAAVSAGASPGDALRASGPVVPGMPNLHSHAFQRALAGRTGRAAADGDSFWNWRGAMYGFLDRVDADGFAAITSQAYVEMLKAGYTSVAEFHYVHHDAGGKPYADAAELSCRVVAAAREVGIALTLLPVFYAHAGFGGSPPLAGQRRFVHTTDSYARLIELLMRAQSRSSAASGERFVLGVAPHSLRAATPAELAIVVALCPRDGPVHIHAAEQMQEVEQCLAATGERPVEWLLNHAAVDARWCLVHATHLAPAEITRLAASAAVAGLAPTTEADLGDGTFPAAAFQRAGGTVGVGSDSNTVVDPFLELRQLEWSQRLALQRRNVLVAGAGENTTVGAALWAAAARGGAQALLQPVGVIAPARRADLVVLDTRDPVQDVQRSEDVLDAAIFGGARRPVRDVLVAGRWVVRDGVHPQEEAVRSRYRRALSACFG
jgi:formimidoylglutamate deiminase